MKFRLVCLLLIGAFALCGCHIDHGSDTSAGAAAEPLPIGDGTATVSWEAPTTTITGSALTDLSGYRIYYGISETDLSERVDLNSVGVQTYVVEKLGAGTWYFAVKAVTSIGVESPLSDIVSKTIS